MSVCWKPRRTAAISTEGACSKPLQMGDLLEGLCMAHAPAVLPVLDQPLVLVLPEPLCLPFLVISGTVLDQHLYGGRHVGGSGFGSSWRQSQMERANTHAKEMHIKRYQELFLGAQPRDAAL